MNKTPILKSLFSLNSGRYFGLPIFGSVMEDFGQWLQAQAYTPRSIRSLFQGAYTLTHWLRYKRRIVSIAEVTPEVLVAADTHFRHRQDEACRAGRCLHRFLRERKAIPAPKPISLSPAQKEASRYAVHLREVRGLAERTIWSHRRCVAEFLEFIGFNHKRSALSWMKHDQIECFMRQMARTHNRFSLLNVALMLRAFLRFEFSQGALPRPLHEQIDMPHVYAGERLPFVLTREQVQTLLHSIDQKSPNGLRDFTMLYLIAVYGLRRSEVVALRLDDIDWRGGILHVRQPKTQQSLVLPLTDEAGNALSRYLRKARPQTTRRELFLRTQAPAGLLTPWAVNVVLQTRVRRSGLDFEKFGPHALRHYADPRTMPTGMARTPIFL